MYKLLPFNDSQQRKLVINLTKQGLEESCIMLKEGLKCTINYFEQALRKAKEME